MHALIANRVPCNDKMTNHPHIICDPIRVLQDERSMVGTLGLLNGVLAAMGLPAVCSIVRDDPRQTLQGFDLYRPKGAE
jgi:hypothetical protein